jgi:phenylacetate-coenzyme A ligase PaaK-like adenylate-forming protein
VKQIIGVTVGIEVTEPGTTESSLGKMKCIVDERPSR